MKFCILILLFFSLNVLGNEPFLLDLADVDWIDVGGVESENFNKERFRFATPKNVKISAGSVGNTVIFDDGLLVWTLGITSPGSKNLNLILKDLSLKIGEYIYIYAPNQENIHQIHQNKHHNLVQTMPINGDSLIIEFQSYQGFEPNFEIETVNCGFVSLNNNYKAAAGFGGSGGCEINASCEDDFADISRSVCRLMVDGNTYGTGVLVNNVNQDGTPYVLTSAHVFGAEKSFKTCVARFGWDAPNCQNKAYSADYQEVTAMKLVTYNELRDCALLLLDSPPPDEVLPFWAGWDIGEDFQGDLSYCIHHPYGDVKKISIGLAPYNSTYTGQTASGNQMAVGNHWRVLMWSQGSTEGGSSGSPLFDKNYHIVGCLTGGEANCSNPVNDYFWQLSQSWEDESQSAEMTLKDALDPENTGKNALDGMDFSADGYKDIYNLDEYNIFVSNENFNYLSEYFPNEQKYKYLYGMFVGVAKVPQTPVNMRVYVYSDDNGKPGNEIKSYLFDSSDFIEKTISYLDFGEGLEIDTSFHLAVEKESSELQFYYSLSGTSDYANFNENGAWRTYHEMSGEDNFCSIFFGARMSNPALKNNEIEIDDPQKGEGSLQIISEGDILKILGNDFEYVNLYGLDGKKYINLENISSKESEIEINLLNLQSGMYILRVKTQESKIGRKILVK